jgi:hypothetical protein
MWTQELSHAICELKSCYTRSVNSELLQKRATLILSLSDNYKKYV